MTRRLAEQAGRIEFNLAAYGLVIHLLLLSTSPRGDAVTVDYGPESVCPERTCTSLIMYACGRTSPEGGAIHPLAGEQGRSTRFRKLETPPLASSRIVNQTCSGKNACGAAPTLNLNLQLPLPNLLRPLPPGNQYM